MKALGRYPRQFGIMVLLMVSLLSLGDLASALGAPGLAQHRQHASGSGSSTGGSAEVDPNPANDMARASAASGHILVYLPFIRTPPPRPSVLRSIADVDVIQGLPASNFGNTHTMWVGYHRAGCAQASVSRGISRGLIRFDVSTIPAGSAITQAVLHVELVGACWRTSRTGETRPVSAYRVAGDWAETVANWSIQPPLAELHGSTAIPLTNQVLNWYALDVTNLVRGWANGSVPNYGLALRSVESAGDEFVWLSFATREWSGSAPYLTLTYAGAQQAEELLVAEATPRAATCAANAEEIVVCEQVGGPTEAK